MKLVPVTDINVSEHVFVEFSVYIDWQWLNFFIFAVMQRVAGVGQRQLSYTCMTAVLAAMMQGKEM